MSISWTYCYDNTVQTGSQHIAVHYLTRKTNNSLFSIYNDLVYLFMYAKYNEGAKIT